MGLWASLLTCINSLGRSTFKVNALRESVLSIRCKLMKYFLGCSLITCSLFVQYQTSRRKVAAIPQDEESGSNKAR